jgi:hypothetical protein
LEQKELDFVLKIGLNTLLQLGAIPFTTKHGDEDIQKSTETVQ